MTKKQIQELKKKYREEYKLHPEKFPWNKKELDEYIKKNYQPNKDKS